MIAGASLERSSAQHEGVDALMTACRIYTDVMVFQYLMANSEGRLDGAKKATIHRELCNFYVAVHLGVPDLERVDREHRDLIARVRVATRELTDHLDEAIGFPLKGRPDYDQLAPRFFQVFHALAMKALSTAPEAEVRH